MEKGRKSPGLITSDGRGPERYIAFGTLAAPVPVPGRVRALALSSRRS
jgi:hypothetical protein